MKGRHATLAHACHNGGHGPGQFQFVKTLHLRHSKVLGTFHKLFGPVAGYQGSRSDGCCQKNITVPIMVPTAKGE
jgi:hypothetical protein